MKKIAFFTTLFLACFSVNAAAFPIPETLKYELSLGGIPIGNLSFDTRDSASSIQMITAMSTVSWVSLFYEVDDRAMTLLKKSRQKGAEKYFPYSTLVYQPKLKEGPHRADMDIIFDHKKKLITCMDMVAKDKTSHSMKAFTLDPLAALYYIRSAPLVPGKSVSFHVFNNKQIRKIDAEVVKRETIKTPLGTFNTVLVRADMYFDGVGVIYYPGYVYIWLTDDERKVPIVIEKRLTTLVEGKLPDFVLEKMPAYLKEKLSTGSIKATFIAGQPGRR